MSQDRSDGSSAPLTPAESAEAAKPEPGATPAPDAAPTQPPEPQPAPGPEPDRNEVATAEPRPRITMRRPDLRHSLAMLLICAGVYVPVMGSYGMFDPWETHYTEVARNFMARNDWLCTWWQNGRGPEGLSETTFWTKPVGSFWMSGLSLKLFGYSGKTTGAEIALGSPEWAVRLPFFLCALFGAFCIYLMCARLFSRRAGLLAGIATATAPMYFMIGRQAMTDMPYVGLMSGGLALFALGVFGEREPLPTRRLKLARWTIDWPHAPSFYLFLAAFLGFMGLQLYAIIPPLLRVPLPFSVAGRPVSAAIGMAIYILLAVAVLFMMRKTRTKNEVYIYTFYLVVGIAGLAKGLIGALQPGLVVLVYLIVSREWRLLTEVALARGLGVAICTFCPWWHGMVARYGAPFWNELVGTEQFRRLTIGEQAQAKGTFEYYLSQLGYGLYPWVAFLPAGLVRAFSIARHEQSPRDRARMFTVVWFAATFVLFSITITKYHHYVLPAIPPAAILCALYLDDLIAGKVRGLPVALLAAACVLGIVTYDLVKYPARWVWMYTYLYEPVWSQGVPRGLPILAWGIASGVAIALMFVPRLRAVAVWATAALAVALGGWTLNWYQLKVAPHWSQKGTIASYYKLRKNAEEELVAWQFNWRGETWYTAGEVVVAKSLDNTAIVQYLNERKGRRFFFITERARFPSLRSMLPTPRGQQTLAIVDDTNIHYVLAAAHL
jgi:4-amino-4-deoxy-L-arabinose transferase-like glycosyltransferase